MYRKIILLVFVSVFAMNRAWACTNFLVTKGASIDGSNMITYAADAHTLYGELYYQPAASYRDGEMRKIHEWDTGKYLGEIPQVKQTYAVVGNMNEHQLAIAETTFGGREELGSQKNAIMDYGSLIYVTLQRAKTAREAIQVMADLVEKYGYYSSGESFSISDPNEIWLMELIGKGEGEKGAVWVALKIPDGYVSGHANQARITTFPQDDSENCVYSPDVISFAVEKGWYKGTNEAFSFSDVYAPVDFGAARFCDARVYAGFNKIVSNMKTYEAYAEGKVEYDSQTGFANNRMPLWVKPDNKLSVKDVMEMMRDHYEGTSLDMTKDLGAGPNALPYRWRGLQWDVDSVTYCNERAISTQQTGFSFVAQSRNWLPNPIGGILWFGVDDTYSTCYAPMYCSITEIPECFKVGNGDMLTYSETSAFWTFNKVTNFAYLRYDDMIKDIRKKQAAIEDRFMESNAELEAKMLEIMNEKKEKKALLLLKSYTTEYSNQMATAMTSEWEKLFQYLLIKYIDGNVKKEKDGVFERTDTGYAVSPDFPGYPDWWYRAIVNSTGEHFKVIKK